MFVQRRDYRLLYKLAILSSVNYVNEVQVLIGLSGSAFLQFELTRRSTDETIVMVERRFTGTGAAVWNSLANEATISHSIFITSKTPQNIPL